MRSGKVGLVKMMRKSSAFSVPRVTMRSNTSEATPAMS